MPELPDLEVTKIFLQQVLLGCRIVQVNVLQPLVLRYPGPETLARTLPGKSFNGVERRGKYLIFALDSGEKLIFHLMLTGRLQWCEYGEKLRARTCVRFCLDNGKELRYFDSRLMGMIYLIPDQEYRLIPRFVGQGPEALDENLDWEQFKKRIRRYPGEMKSLLVNQSFIAGIGNAYADEILFAARIYPFRRRSSLSEEELRRLYQSISQVLKEAITELSFRMKENIHLEIRDFLKIHGRGGLSCPVCGGRISEVRANQRITNFCRHCQK